MSSTIVSLLRRPFIKPKSRTPVTQTAAFALLPAELIIEIFLAARSSDTSYDHIIGRRTFWRKLSLDVGKDNHSSMLSIFLVCKRFYVIAMKYQELWTCASINLCKLGNIAHAVHALQPFFRRSGTKPLRLACLKFTFKRALPEDQIAELNSVLARVDSLHLDGNTKSLANLFNRNYIMIDGPDGFPVCDLAKAAAAGVQLDQFNRLSLVMRIQFTLPISPPQTVHITADARALSLKFHGPTRVILARPHSLTALRLTMDVRAWTCITRSIFGALLVHTAPSLEILEIAIIRKDPSEIVPHMYRPLEFPRLRVLLISGTNLVEDHPEQMTSVGEVISRIWAPALEELTIDICPPDALELVTSYQILTIMAPEATATAAGRWHALPRIAEENETLRKLTLRNILTDPDWIFERLCGLESFVYELDYYNASFKEFESFNIHLYRP